MVNYLIKCTYIMFKNGKPCELDIGEDEILLNLLKSNIEFDFYRKRFKPGHKVLNNVAEEAYLISWGHDIEDILKFEKEFWDYLIDDAENDKCHSDYIDQLRNFKKMIISYYEAFTLNLLD